MCAHLFKGDEITSDAALCKHLNTTLNFDAGGEGIETFLSDNQQHPSPPPTPFMAWMERSENRFFFAFPKGHTIQKVPSSLFYTCNVSLKHSLISSAGTFDESFTFASHKDIELGHRLGETGMILHFDRSVVAHHHHHLSVMSAARRCYYMGYSAPIYWRKVVDRSSHMRKTLRKVLATLAASTPVRWYWKKLLKANATEDAMCPCSWPIILSLSYWTGYSDGLGKTLDPPEINTAAPQTDLS